MDTRVRVKAAVMCAGYGTRLGSLTGATPKPMLLVAGRPILDYTLTHLSISGVREVGINLHYLPEVIRSYVGKGEAWGLDVTFFEESELLGTAGTLLNMAPFLEDSDAFLVMYGDILTDQSIDSFMEFHLARSAEISMLIHESPNSNSVVVRDDVGKVTRFLERPSPEVRETVASSWASSAVFVVSPAALRLIPDCIPADIPKDLLPQVLDRGRLYSYPLQGYRCAIDSSERLARAGRDVVEEKCRIGRISS